MEKMPQQKGNFGKTKQLLTIGHSLSFVGWF